MQNKTQQLPLLSHNRILLVNWKVKQMRRNTILSTRLNEKGKERRQGNLMGSEECGRNGKKKTRTAQPRIKPGTLNKCGQNCQRNWLVMSPVLAAQWWGVCGAIRFCWGVNKSFCFCQRTGKCCLRKKRNRAMNARFFFLKKKESKIQGSKSLSP